MVKTSVDHSLFLGFAVGARGSKQVHISHLLFADDTLVFCGASRDQVQAIGNLLTCFELVSGLKVNLAKSVLVLVGMQAILKFWRRCWVVKSAFYLFLTWACLWGPGSKIRRVGMGWWKSPSAFCLAGRECIFLRVVGLHL
jgi:hypothetical protein